MCSLIFVSMAMCGNAGKLEMQIPWKKLTKDPLVITINDVFVIVEPNIGMEYSE